MNIFQNNFRLLRKLPNLDCESGNDEPLQPNDWIHSMKQREFIQRANCRKAKQVQNKKQNV